MFTTANDVYFLNNSFFLFMHFKNSLFWYNFSMYIESRVNILEESCKKANIIAFFSRTHTTNSFSITCTKHNKVVKDGV